MKYTILLVLAATALLASCQSTTESKKVVESFAKVGNAYVQASPRISPENKVFIQTAIKVVTTKKFDRASIVSFAKAAASAQLSQSLSMVEQSAVVAALEAIESGKIDTASLLLIANKAAADYATSQGLSPQEVAAVTALAQILAGSAI